MYKDVDACERVLAAAPPRAVETNPLLTMYSAIVMINDALSVC